MYSKKKMDLKKVQRSGKSRSVVEKAENEMHRLSFLTWLDTYLQVRETKTNIDQEDSSQSITQGDVTQNVGNEDRQQLSGDDDAARSVDSRDTEDHLNSSKLFIPKNACTKKRKITSHSDYSDSLEQEKLLLM